MWLHKILLCAEVSLLAEPDWSIAGNRGILCLLKFHPGTRPPPGGRAAYQSWCRKQARELTPLSQEMGYFQEREGSIITVCDGDVLVTAGWHCLLAVLGITSTWPMPLPAVALHSSVSSSFFGPSLVPGPAASSLWFGPLARSLHGFPFRGESKSFLASSLPIHCLRCHSLVGL